MPNYFKTKDTGTIKLNGVTIEGEGKEGLGNAAEQYVSELLGIPAEKIKEITREEYEELGKR